MLRTFESDIDLTFEIVSSLKHKIALLKQTANGESLMSSTSYSFV